MGSGDTVQRSPASWIDNRRLALVDVSNNEQIDFTEDAVENQPMGCWDRGG